MQWSDAITPPGERTLRQFAALCLLFLLGAAVWHAYRVGIDGRTTILTALGVAIGGLGLWRPKTIRYLFTGWMVAAFPIGWTLSKVALAALFFVVFTVVAWVFRLIGRDALHLRRPHTGSLWIRRHDAAKADEYLRQF